MIVSKLVGWPDCLLREQSAHSACTSFSHGVQSVADSFLLASQMLLLFGLAFLVSRLLDRCRVAARQAGDRARRRPIRFANAIHGRQATLARCAGAGGGSG